MKMQIKNEGLRVSYIACPLIMDESSARMRNVGGGLPQVYMGRPARFDSRLCLNSFIIDR